MNTAATTATPESRMRESGFQADLYVTMLIEGLNSTRIFILTVRCLQLVTELSHSTVSVVACITFAFLRTIGSLTDPSATRVASLALLTGTTTGLFPRYPNDPQLPDQAKLPSQNMRSGPRLIADRRANVSNPRTGKLTCNVMWGYIPGYAASLPSERKQQH